MKTYELIFNEEENPLGVYGASLVDNPANEYEAIFLSKEETFDSVKLKVKLSNEEKRIVISPLLIPNRKIYRNNAYKGEPGYVFFSENTIEKLQQNFFKQNFNHNSTIGHENKIEGVYIFESWIVEDPEKDKSNHYGFNLPKGSWVVTMKIDNDDVWENYVKTKEVKGLSIDALLEPILVEDNNNYLFKKMKKETINEIVAKAIQEVALASDLKQFKDKDGKEYYASELGEGFVVTDSDGNPMKSQSFEVDGVKYNTDDMGSITSMETVVVEDVIEDSVEDVVEDSIEEQVVVVDEVPVVEDTNELEYENEALKAKVNSLEEENTRLQELINTMNEEVVLMKKETPASGGIQEIELNKEENKTNKNLSTMEALRNVINN
jgi:hypothetical protein